MIASEEFDLPFFLCWKLDLATSGKGGVGPYIGICAIVGSFGVADANVQGGMVGDLSFMRPEFIQVFLLLRVLSMFFENYCFSY